MAGSGIRPVIVTCAVTGSVHVPSQSPYLPLTPEQIAQSAIDAGSAGAAILHLHARIPDAPQRLSREIVAFVQAIRKEDLFKAPGVAETLDWASALTELDAVALDPNLVTDTRGVLLKSQDDIARIDQAKASELVNEVAADMKARV